jgi:hypothetical protein
VKKIASLFLAAPIFLTALATVVRMIRRRRDKGNIASEVSARQHIESSVAIPSDRIRASGADPDGRAVRDVQAPWSCEQDRIALDSVISVVRGVRAAITHGGATEARTVLDGLQRLAHAGMRLVSAQNH